MIKYFLAVILVIWGFAGFSQDKEELIGKWKIASIKDESSYFNFETDSFSFAKLQAEGSGQTKVPDSTIQQTKSFLRTFLGKFELEFKKDGKFTMQMGDKLNTSGSFLLDEKSGRIQMTEKGKPNNAEAKLYSLKDGILQLKDAEDDGRSTEMTFKRFNP